MIDMLEIFLEKVLDILLLDNPRSDDLFDLLLFLNDDFGGIDFNLLELVGFYSFIDFGFELLFFLDFCLDVNEGVVSKFLIVFDFGDLFDLC
jgi:hypothetical protein